jgi:23S rRNA (adenine2503-C2)-methyltransferase
MERVTAETIGIKALSRDEIKQMVTEELGQPAFRAKQIIQWIYGKGAKSYDEMTNLPLSLRTELAGKYPLNPARIVRRQVSQDGTRKYLVGFRDSVSVETVGIPSKNRLTVCVSTQAGCPLRCAFCATGKGGYVRNLGVGEIVDQVRVVADDFGQRVSSVVLMGQGEPFLNYDAVIEAIRILNSKDGFEIGARHITVSTSGILPQIRRFAAEPEQFTLAVSLHSAVQSTRDEIMPGVRKYPLERLRESIASYAEVTGRRPTYEYALMEGVNDSNAELKALVAFCRQTLCHVNFINLNPAPGCQYGPVSKERIGEFVRALNTIGIETTVRESRGSDIDAACGQLKQRQ